MICSVNRSLSGAGVLLRDRQFSSLKMIVRDNVQERSYFYWTELFPAEEVFVKIKEFQFFTDISFQ